MTQDKFIDLYTVKEHARMFRDIGEYSKHEWIDENTLDIEYATKVLWKTYPVRLRLTVDKQNKKVSFCSLGTDQAATVRGVWNTKYATSNRTIVTFHQHMIIHHVPKFVNISSFLRRRVMRALDDVRSFSEGADV